MPQAGTCACAMWPITPCNAKSFPSMYLGVVVGDEMYRHNYKNGKMLILSFKKSGLCTPYGAVIAGTWEVYPGIYISGYTRLCIWESLMLRGAVAWILCHLMHGSAAAVEIRAKEYLWEMEKSA